MSSFGILGDRRFVSVNVIVTTTTKSVEEKILGVTLNKDLNFKNHLNKLCKKAGQKLHALARISNYVVDVDKLMIIMNAFIISHLKTHC